MSKYDELITRKVREYGGKFSDAELWPQFRPYYHGERVRVRTTYDDGTTRERTGTVGVTTGWRPAFLLMSRSNAIGSSDVLRKDDEIIAVKRGRKYAAAVQQ